MSRDQSHYKLGLFVILSATAAVLAGVLLGAAGLRKETVRYHSYFNESVQGLDVGSPVKFRGVTIGSVFDIAIAPDHRMVDVVSELDTKEVKRMGLTEAGAKHGSVRFAIPPDLRAQLGSQGITGVKFIAIDFFDVRGNPAPNLPFATPPQHYIPAAPSMMKNLEDSITKAMDRLPEMVDAVVTIMARVDRLLATLEKDDVSGKAASTLLQADVIMKTLHAAIARVDKQNIGGKAATTITELSVAVNKMNAVLDRLSSDKGLLASAERATEAFGDMGRSGRGTQRDFEAMLREVAEAAQAIHALVDALDRDPDMLLKGKSKTVKVAP
jgi:paraquat-inducible protein B